MSGVAEGYGIIGILVAVGVLIAHAGLADETVQRALGTIVYSVATPCLLFSLLAETDALAAIGPTFAVAVASVFSVLAIYVPVARWVWRRPVHHVVVGGLSASYVNAGNLGVPIAVFVLHDASFVVPILLLQLLVLAPGALALLETVSKGHRPKLLNLLWFGARNPVTIGAALGLAFAATGWGLPVVVSEPISLLGQMSVPGALLAFGISLRLGSRLGRSGGGELAFICALKEVVQPVVAYGVGRFVLGLDHHLLYGVTVMAALPTAQNVFIYASRFGRSSTLARDSTVVSTVVSIPAILVIAAILG